jgi:hypothetical protein
VAHCSEGCHHAEHTGKPGNVPGAQVAACALCKHALPTYWCGREHLPWRPVVCLCLALLTPHRPQLEPSLVLEAAEAKAAAESEAAAEAKAAAERERTRAPSKGRCAQHAHVSCMLLRHSQWTVGWPPCGLALVFTPLLCGCRWTHRKIFSVASTSFRKVHL